MATVNNSSIKMAACRWIGSQTVKTACRDMCLLIGRTSWHCHQFVTRVLSMKVHQGNLIGSCGIDPANYPKVRETSISYDDSMHISVPGIPEPCCLPEFFVMSMPFFVIESFLKQVASVMGNTSKITTRDPIVPHFPVRMLMISGRGSKPLFSLLKEVYLSSNCPPPTLSSFASSQRNVLRWSYFYSRWISSNYEVWILLIATQDYSIVILDDRRLPLYWTVQNTRHKIIHCYFALLVAFAMMRETHKSEWQIAGCTPSSPGQVANAWGVRYRSHALTAWRAGRKVIQRIAGMLPPALPRIVILLAASLGALARLGKTCWSTTFWLCYRRARGQESFDVGRRDVAPCPVCRKVCRFVGERITT